MWYKAYNMLYDDEYVFGSQHGTIFDTELTDKDLMVTILEDWCISHCNGAYSVKYNEKYKKIVSKGRIYFTIIAIIIIFYTL